MHSTTITGVIDRFEGDIAVISFDDGQKLNWSKISLPADAHEGSVVTLQLTTNTQDEAHRQQLAKAVLQELINPQDSN